MPLSIKHVLLDCAGLNILRTFFFYSVNSFEESFKRVKPNTVIKFLAKINFKNMI